MPDIPTADETGVPGLYMSGWFGFFAPKGTPKDIIAKLNAATVEALADPAIQKRFTELGPRRRPPRATDAGRPRRVPEDRDRQMVADHQGVRDRRAGAVRAEALVGMKMDGKTVLITGSTDGVGRYVAATTRRIRRQGPDPWPRPARAKTLIEEINGQGAASRPSIKPIFLACRGAKACRSRACRPQAARCLRQQCRNRIAERGPGAADQPGRSRTALRRQLSLRLSARPSAAALVEGEAPSRIVNVASLGQHPIDFDDVMITRGYSGGRAYAQSKLSQIMFTIDLAERTQGQPASPSIRCIRRPT